MSNAMVAADAASSACKQNGHPSVKASIPKKGKDKKKGKESADQRLLLRHHSLEEGQREKIRGGLRIGHRWPTNLDSRPPRPRRPEEASAEPRPWASPSGVKVDDPRSAARNRREAAVQESTNVVGVQGGEEERKTAPFIKQTQRNCCAMPVKAVWEE